MKQRDLTRSAAARALVLITAAAALLLSTPLRADAHAVLVSSSPEDGAKLATEPARVSLRFNENIGTPAYVIVVAPDGTHAEKGKPTILDHTITQVTKPLGIAGRYTMSYRVVSADGHVVEAVLHFTVSAGRQVRQVDSEPSESFVHRHAGHITWGVAGIVAAGVILFWPWRKRDA